MSFDKSVLSPYLTLVLEIVSKSPHVKPIPGVCQEKKVVQPCVCIIFVTHVSHGLQHNGESITI